MISLKKAEISDTKEIHQMQVAAFTPLLEKYQDFDTSPAAEPLEKILWRMEMPNSEYYFILADEVKVGVVRIRWNEKHHSISPIFILPEYQGYGYAQQAIQLAEALYPEAKCWVLDTIWQESKLLHLYQKMGYHFTGSEHVVNDRMTLVDLVKII